MNAGKDQGDWRRPGRGPSEQYPQSATSTVLFSPDWRGKSNNQTSKLKHFLFVVSLMAVALVLALVLIYWLTARPKHTDLKVFSVALYNEDPHHLLLPNPYAVEDAELFERTFARTHDVDVSLTIQGGAADGYVSRDELTTELSEWMREQAVAGGPDEIVMIYISGHGLVNEDREPCLLTSDAKPRDSTTWLKLEKVFDTICKAEKFKGKKKVVLLDCNRIGMQLNLGVFYNEFTEQLRGLVQLTENRTTGDPKHYHNLVVINSTSPGEVGHFDPRRGHSIFAYFCARGLAGAADGFSTPGDMNTGAHHSHGKKDGKIALSELKSYLQYNVDRWGRSERLATQRPVIIRHDPNDTADSFLAYCNIDQTMRTEVSQDKLVDRRENIRKRFRITAERWQEYAELMEDAPYTVRPIQWSKLEHELLMLDRYALAGKAYTSGDPESLFERLQKKIHDQLESWPKADGFSSPVPRAADQHGMPSDDLVQAYEAWLNPPTSPAPKTAPDDTTDATKNDNVKESEDQAAAAKQVPEPPWLPDYVDRCRFAWQQLLSSDTANVANLKKFLDATPTDSHRITPLEIHLFRLLDVWSDEERRTDTPQLLKTFDRAQLATAPGMPRSHYWIKEVVDEADIDRRRIENQWVGADESGTEPDTAAVQNKYEKAINRRATIDEAYALRDQALWKLPWLEQWALAQLKIPALESNVRRDNDTDRLNRLNRLVGQVAELSRILNEADVTGLDKLKTAMDDVERQLSSLVLEFDGTIKELRDQKTGRRNEFFPLLSSFLNTPLLNDKNRQVLRGRFLDLCFEEPQSPLDFTWDNSEYVRLLAESPFALLGAQSLERTATPTKTGADAEVDLNRSLRVLWQRNVAMQPFIGALESEAKDHAKEFETRFSEERENPVVAVRRKLARADLVVRERIAWRPDFVWDHPETSLEGLPPPPQRLRKVDRYFYCLWQCERTLADGWGPSPEGENPYFAKVAAAFLQSARDCFPQSTSYERRQRERVETVSSLFSRRNSLQSLRTSPTAVEPDVSLYGDKYKATLRWPDELPGVSETAVFLLRDSLDRTVTLDVDDQGQFTRKAIILNESNRENSAFHFQLNALDEALHSQPVTATALFRFHARARTIPLQTVDPIVMKYPSAKTTITVRGQGSAKCYIIFVLDCSGSMNESRMNTARKAMEDSLNVLGENHRIGILCYGHRAKFEERTYDMVLSPFARARQIDGEIDPREDVAWLELRDGNTVEYEAVHDQLRNNVSDALKQLDGHGQTPLYRAMKTALETFRRKNRNSLNPLPEKLVVITDGVDRPGNPPDGRHPQVKPITLDDVKDTLRATSDGGFTDLDVSILFVGGKPKRKDYPNNSGRYNYDKVFRRDRVSFQELKEWTNEKQQILRLIEIEDETTLSENLQRAIGEFRFRVQSGDGDTTQPEEKKRLGEEWDTKWPGNPEGMEFLTEVYNTFSKEAVVERKTRLFGGEAIELEFSEGQLKHDKYENDNIEDELSAVNLVDPANTNRAFSVHYQREGGNSDGARIVLVVENSVPEEFTPRPRQVWVEVSPAEGDAASKAPAFVFYDLPYKPREPVPILDFETPTWPDNCKSAHAAFWFSFDEMENLFDMFKDRYRTKGKEWEGWRKEVGPDGVDDFGNDERITISVERTVGNGAPVIRVREEHERQETLRSYQTTIRSDPLPEQVSHKYYDEAKQVVREFVFPKSRSGFPVFGDEPVLFVVPVTWIKESGRFLQTGKMKVGLYLKN